MEKIMENKKTWLKMLVIVLVLGMAAVGCENNPTESSTYDPTGTWDFNFQGQSATINIGGNIWTAIIPGLSDSGSFTLNGNTGTLYSNTWEANIGTATLTSNTTMTLTLVSPSLITGTFNGTKR
jgi:hypothetical protein